MKLLRWMFALVLVGSTSLAFAACGSCDEGCKGEGTNFCCENTSFFVYGDVLYWKTCPSDTDHSGGSVHYDQPDHDVGYRIGAQFKCDCKDVGVRYTSYDNSDAYDSSNRYGVEFESVDVEFGYSFCVPCVDATLRPFIGAKFAWIDEVFVDSGDVFTSNVDGIGLYLGSDFRWPFYEACYCDTTYPISLLTRVSWAVLDAEVHQKDTSNGPWDKHCLYVNVIEAFVGVELGLTLCDCWALDLMLGYEVQNWMGLRRMRDGDDLSSLGFSGLTFRVGSRF